MSEERVADRSYIEAINRMLTGENPGTEPEEVCKQ